MKVTLPKTSRPVTSRLAMSQPLISRLSVSTILLTVLCMCLSVAGCSDQVVLRASHQWPGGTGDLRDEMVEIIARDFNAANLGLTIRVYPGASLFK